MTRYDYSIDLAHEFSKRLGGCCFRPSLGISENADIETELSRLILDEKEMIEWSDKLSKYFFGEEGEKSAVMCSVPRISDFSSIVAFAESADGMPFCFDYRGSETSPSIIWWDDDRWILVCDNPNDFIKLFEGERSRD